mmetsp:Transcript_20718/g.58774  ORF Transcript_20718/g.58774 Transcript_20718/m.58774 type:complete len:200 (-) Transcript_20718:492-1091(-)
MTVITLGHARFFHNATDLRLKSHIQHSISLIEHQETDIFHAQPTTFNQVDQTTRGSNEEITSAFDFTELLAHLCASINTHGGDTGAIGETFRFVVNLLSKLASGCHHQGLGINTTPRALRRRAATVLQHGHDDGEQKACCLSGTSLGTSHQVATNVTNRHRVLLHRSGPGVSTELGVAVKVFADGFWVVFIDRLRAAIP